MFWVAGIVGVVIGFFIAVFVMSLCACASGREKSKDLYSEECRKKVFAGGRP